MGGEKHVRNPFLHNKKELDKAEEALKDDIVGLFYFFKRNYESVFGDIEWDMWDGGVPPIEERIKLMKAALIDGRKIPDKFFAEPDPKAIY